MLALNKWSTLTLYFYWIMVNQGDKLSEWYLQLPHLLIMVSREHPVLAIFSGVVRQKFLIFSRSFMQISKGHCQKQFLTSGLPDSVHNNHPIRYSVHLSLNISETAHYLLLKFCMKLWVNKVKKSNTARL